LARTESIALGGFYPCPPHLVSRVARLLGVDMTSLQVFVDPCAGEGAAVRALADAMVGEHIRTHARFYLVEMDATRHATLKAAQHDVDWRSENVLLGDAFNVEWSHYGKSGATVLWLNPPYDTDKIHGRLEQAFLARWAGCLMDGGALVFVVPHHALAASAATLAQHFDEVSCWRFPEPDFAAYRQVFLVARKRPALFAPDADVMAQVKRWSRDAESIPLLPEDGEPLWQVAGANQWNVGFASWGLADLDMRGLALGAQPWQQTDKRGALCPVAGVVPEGAVADLLDRHYPVAMPPRPAHIAAAIAAGVFNGARLEPDDATTGLPPVLVKGVFDKDWRKIEEKQDKDGNVKSVVEIQQPRLVVTVLDLRGKRYHTIAAGAEPSGATRIDALNTADLITHYGRALMGTLRTHCPVLHDPQREGDRFPLLPLARPLYAAQAEAVRACVRLLGGPGVSPKIRRGKAALLLGEIGSGKTGVALATAQEIGAQRVLVVCPPHLLQGWIDQLAAVLPEARASVIGDVEDVRRYAEDRAPGLHVAVLSRETAKLGHAWVGVPERCPRCGGDVPKETDLAKTRARCQRQAHAPKDAVAEVATRLGRAWSLVWPAETVVQQLAPGRMFRARRQAARKASVSADAVWQRSLDASAIDAAVRDLLGAMGQETDEERRGKIAEAIVLLCLAAPDYAPVAWAAEAIHTCALVVGNYGPWGDGVRAARELLFLLPRDEQDRVETAMAEARREAVRGQRWSYHASDDG
jgi:hypothetical protein